MIDGFSTYTGADFLWFYALMILGSVVAGIWLPAFLRADGESRRITDRYELAYLVGGPKRVTEAVLAHLLGTGALHAAGSRKVTVIERESGEGPLEREILRKTGDFGITEAHKSVSKHTDGLLAGLVRDRLLLTRSERWQLRLVSVLPYLVVLAIGWYRRTAGIGEGEPVGYLTMMMVVLALLATIRLLKLDPRTRGGLAAIAEGKAASARLKSAPIGPELGFGVALFGTAILAGTPFSELHAMRQAASGGDGAYTGDGGGDSGGSDGGCGGGCGGCGG